MAAGSLQAQTYTASDLPLYEDSLRRIGDSIIMGSSYEVREAACVRFIPQLVQALKCEGSFEYPFAGVRTMSVVQPEDATFRIFTFHMELWDKTYRHFGAIQLNQGELKLIPLIDASLFIKPADAVDTALTSDSWHGAIYYNVIGRKHKGQDYYFLFGLDAWDLFSTKKVLDVLWFDKEGTAHFGAPMFPILEEIPDENESEGEEEETASEEKKKEEPALDDNPIASNQPVEEEPGPIAEPEEEEEEDPAKPTKRFTGEYGHRFFIEYNKESSAGLNWDPYLELIIYDHLIPENPLSKGIPSTYVSDGSYEGLKWKRGRWQWVDKVFNQTQDSAPLNPPPGSEEAAPGKQGPQGP